MNAKTAVCTLFEKDYHYGVAALINSLHENGYRGNLFAGYKGSLPYWAKNLSKNFHEYWHGAKTMQIKNDITIHFLPLTTNWHLTNYKPDFMLELKEKFPVQVKNIFYFDPDIIIKYHWQFFEDWIVHGVALVHEIASAYMTPTHPIRREWEKIIEKCNKHIQRSLYSGINGGFCGVREKNFDFIRLWSDIINAAIKFHNVAPDKFTQTNAGFIFHFADQDALNMAAMCYENSISEMGPDAMDFIPGGWKIMSHATGSPKPWNKIFLLLLLKATTFLGRPCLLVKCSWLN